MAGRTNLDAYIQSVARAITPVTANAADVVFTASDSGNGNSVTLNGSETLLVFNNHGSLAKTVTLTMRTDPAGAAGAITAYSVGSKETAIFRPQPTDVWGQPTTGYLFLDSESTDIQYAILRYT